jgi:two-component system, NarL family, sensor histidine kinase BarA
VKNLGIKYQLRIITLIPVLLVALLFALVYNQQYNKNLNQHTSRLGHAFINQLLPAAQFAILHNDNRTLQELIENLNINPEIQAVAFYDTKGQLLAYGGGNRPLTKCVCSTSNNR